jgi:c(7)-type cytochrome triheme protein
MKASSIKGSGKGGPGKRLGDHFAHKSAKGLLTAAFRAPTILFLVLAGSIAIFLQPVMAEYGDVIINNKAEKNGMRPVIFPHWFHRIRFKCKVCHLELGFQMKAGSNNITMEAIVNKTFCGACHNGQMAWGPVNCDMCHTGKPGLKSGIRRGHTTGGAGIL